jgi:hypothetical protein
MKKDMYGFPESNYDYDYGSSYSKKKEYGNYQGYQSKVTKGGVNYTSEVGGNYCPLGKYDSKYSSQKNKLSEYANKI